MFIENYAHFGGAHSETAALKNILAHSEVVAPHTKRPYTEAMLLGIGGGIGAGYHIGETSDGVRFRLGTRHLWQHADAAFIQTICKRIGATVTISETSGSKAAAENLRQALSADRPAIAWGSLAGLPYYGLAPDLLKTFAHVFVVYGLDEKNRTAWIDDRAIVPIRLRADDLTASRSAIASLKHRIATVTPPRKSPDLRKAIISGIRDCSRDMFQTKDSHAGLPGLEKWADSLTDRKSKKGWSQSFKPGLSVYRALLEIFQAIETEVSGGGAFRAMYADFLDEAATALDKSAQPLLTEAAAQFRRSARLWKQLAHTALPESVSLLCEAREIIVARQQLLAAKGASLNGQMDKISRRLAAIEREADEAFPLKAKQAQELFATLQSTLRKICDAERHALTRLQQIVC